MFNKMTAEDITQHREEYYIQYLPVKIEKTIPKIPSATIIALSGLVVGSNKSSELLEDNDGAILLLNSFWSVMIFTLINELNKSLIIWHKLQLSA